MNRPTLNRKIAADDFRSYYWLKEELTAFCRDVGLSTTGGKQEIAARIVRFLETGERESVKSAAKPKSGAMPVTFTRDTLIGANWRCSEPLRAFFSAETGKSYKFNQLMRDFIKEGEGKTLGEALDTWQADQEKPQPRGEIAVQFEYNRHMRAYFDAHPEATRADAIRAWHTAKAKRRASE